MPDVLTEKPISVELRDAFRQAVAAFENWSYGMHEPKVSLDRDQYSVDAICNLVSKFPGAVPETAYSEVHRLAADFRGGYEAHHHNCDGPKDHTYATVAECLQRLYAARKAHFERLRAAL
jgi:hypothetical protein